MKKYIKFLFLISFFVASCSNKKDTKDSYFEIPIVNYYPDLYKRNYDNNSGKCIDSSRYIVPACYIYAIIDGYSSEKKNKYSVCEQFFEFEGTSAEIEYSLPDSYHYKGKWFSKDSKYFIGIKETSGVQRGFLIHWINMKKSLEVYKKDTSQNKSNDYKEYFSGIPWEIGNHTDSLETNLSYNEIKNLYPIFQGGYKHILCDSIVITHDSTRFTYHNPKIYFRNN